MKLSDSEIQAIIIAAVKAEAWFTHTEVTSDDKLDYEAFQVADKLRGALRVVEDKAPQLLKEGIRLHRFWWFYRLFGFITRRYSSGYGLECPHCGYEGFEMFEKPYFACTNNGVSCVPGEPTIHWFEGDQTCPRCGYAWFVQDSD